MNEFDPKNFLFRLPLYTKITFTADNLTSFLNLINFTGKIDEYSISLKEQTTYKVSDSPGRYLNALNLNAIIGIRHFRLECVRTSDKVDIYINVVRDDDKSWVEKIGQNPSIADFEISQIKEYKSVLSPDLLKEFIKAIGLATHGIGIGSFVYLRRIFESLIEEAHGKSKAQSGWDDKAYHLMRMANKIEALKDNLPVFLVENKSLYGILSKGIHELSENECLSYFDVVKAGIEFILDEKLEHYIKQKKMTEAKSKIQVITQAMKKNP